MHFLSSLFSRYKKATKAFTLIELMVVLGIFALLTGITVYRYRDFNNNIILTNVAYEVGLLVRQAQVYGLSVRGTGGSSNSFDQGYGVLVDKATHSFSLCVDIDGDEVCNIASGEDTAIDTLELPTGYTISELKTMKAGESERDTSRLSVVFLRPDPNAYIVGDDQDSTYGNSEANIMITSPSGQNTKTVIIWHTGQISVK